MRTFAVSGLVLFLALFGVACEEGPTSSDSVSAVSVTGTVPTIGTSSQFTAIATVSGATQDVTSLATWSSSNPSVATVFSPGIVTAVASGTAVITAAYSNVSGTITITVS